MRSVFLRIKYVPTIRLSDLRKVFSLLGKSEKIALFLLVVIALGSFAVMAHGFYVAHSIIVPARGGVYREGILGQPKYINPLLASSGTDSAISRLLFAGLYKNDGTGNVIPDLADGFPDISENQKEYIVHLKRDLTWQNNEPLRADDIVFTVDSIKNSEYRSVLRGEWSNTDVEKIDDYTVKFINLDISGPFLQTLTAPIISQKFWSQIAPQDFATAAATLEDVGNGPYVLREIKRLPDDQVKSLRLESFSNYHAGKPNIDTIEILFYQNYEDMLNALHSREITGFGFLPFDQGIYVDRDRKNLEIHELPVPQYEAAFFNLSRKTLSDVKVRQALSLAIDRQEVLGKILSGYGRLMEGPILPEQGALPLTSSPEFNPGKAADLLSAAGWRTIGNTKIRAKAGQQLELTLATNDFSVNVNTAELLAEAWQKLGVKINLNILPTPELMNNVILPRNFDILLFSHKIGADPDPFLFWHSSQTKNPGLNLTSYANTVADQYITEARSTTSKEVRDDRYQKFQSLIIGDVPAVFLNQSIYIYAVDSSIQGETFKSLVDPSARFYDVPNWYIDQKRQWQW